MRARKAFARMARKRAQEARAKKRKAAKRSKPKRRRAAASPKVTKRRRSKPDYLAHRGQLYRHVGPVKQG